jgi:hypothetical protein
MFLNKIFNGTSQSNEILPLFRLHVPPRPLHNCCVIHSRRFRLSTSQRSLFHSFPSFYSLASKYPSPDSTSSATVFKTSIKHILNNSPPSYPEVHLFVASDCFVIYLYCYSIILLFILLVSQCKGPCADFGGE